jgi:hypothetical protein
MTAYDKSGPDLQTELLEVITDELYNVLSNITSTKLYDTVQATLVTNHSILLRGYVVNRLGIKIEMSFISFENNTYLHISPYYVSSFINVTLIDIKDAELFEKAGDAVRKALEFYPISFT